MACFEGGDDDIHDVTQVCGVGAARCGFREVKVLQAAELFHGVIIISAQVSVGDFDIAHRHGGVCVAKDLHEHLNVHAGTDHFCGEGMAQSVWMESFRGGDRWGEFLEGQAIGGRRRPFAEVVHHQIAGDGGWERLSPTCLCCALGLDGLDDRGGFGADRDDVLRTSFSQRDK